MNNPSKMTWNNRKLFSQRNFIIPTLACMVLTVSFVLSIPAPSLDEWRQKSLDGVRHPKTLNMTMGMGMVKDMLQNGVPFRPVPPPFPSLKNLFRVNGTHLTWVPLGSLLFANNGKIIGG